MLYLIKRHLSMLFRASLTVSYISQISHNMSSAIAKQEVKSGKLNSNIIQPDIHKGHVTFVTPTPFNCRCRLLYVINATN